jgi:predicted amidohydrolase
MGAREGGGTEGAGMGAGDQPIDSAELIDKLRDADDLARIVALLWSWLAQHLVVLDSRSEKLSALRRRVDRDVGGYDKVDDEALAWLQEDPLSHAAELLVRIGDRLVTDDQGVNRGGRMFIETTDIEDRPVVVIVRHMRLAGMVGDGHLPLDAVENPSLTTLTPRLVVSPIAIGMAGARRGAIRLEFLEPEETPAWDLAWLALDEVLGPIDSDHGAGESNLQFKVHLDPLREHGVDGLLVDKDRPVARFDEDKLGKAGAARCITAAREAIARAGDGGPGILVMPELAAAPTVEEAIKQELAGRADKGEQTPLLTVVGLYHRKPDPGTGLESDLVASEDLAPWVNEAIVLGPTGEEVWRHRKLSPAGGYDKKRGEYISEDIQLGDKLIVVPTPLGHIGVVICLDSFAPHVCTRLSTSGAEIVIVPSLSDGVDRHRRSLTQIVQQLSGIAFVCNRAVYPSEDGIGGWNLDENRSFWAVQTKGSVDMPAWEGNGHPSFVFDLESNLAA